MRSTTRQYDVLNAIRAYKDEHGFSPSMRDLMGMTGITSLSVVSYYLRRLENDGLIRRTENINRSIEVTGMIIRTPELKLMDQRKNIHAQLSQKRSAAGKAGKGATAFVPKKKKDDGL